MPLFSIQKIIARCDVCGEEKTVDRVVVPDGQQFLRPSLPQGWRYLPGTHRADVAIACDKHRVAVIVDGESMWDKLRERKEEENA